MICHPDWLHSSVLIDKAVYLGDNSFIQATAVEKLFLCCSKGRILEFSDIYLVSLLGKNLLSPNPLCAFKHFIRC